MPVSDSNLSSPALRQRRGHTPSSTTTTATTAARGGTSPPRGTLAQTTNTASGGGFAVFRNKRTLDSPDVVVAAAAVPSPSTPKSQKRNVTERLQRLRRKLNPRANAVRWRYRLSHHQNPMCQDVTNDQQGSGDEFGLDMDDEEDDSTLEALLHDSHGHTSFPSLEMVDVWETNSLPSSQPTSRSPPPMGSRENWALNGSSSGNMSQGRSVSFDFSSLENNSSKTSFPPVAPFSSAPLSSLEQQLQQCAIIPSISAHQLAASSPSPTIRRFGSDRKEFRVRPVSCFPDPTYMTEAEIYHNMTLPSQNVQFVESFIKPSSSGAKQLRVPPYIEQIYGSPQTDGRIGSLRVEVLGCVGLSRSKPDVAVYLICGDGAFCTDVVTNCRSPMWPNLSRRAAVFALHHGYARLYVGVFDVRSTARKHNKENDSFCGRVVLDIATLRPGSEYDVTFPLRASSFIYDRRPRGVVRLRFSLYWFSERLAMMSYWKSGQCTTSSLPNQQPTIPCADPKTFRNVALTIHGQDLPGKYSRKAFRATMREFNLYQQNLRYWIQTLAFDTVFYEKPMMSFYLFLAWMHCIHINAVRLVPAYFVGFLIYLFCDSYIRYNRNPTAHLGYQPVSIPEMISALVQTPRKDFISLNRNKKSRKTSSASSTSPISPLGNNTRFFDPILVRKKPKKNHQVRAAQRAMASASAAGSSYGSASDKLNQLDKSLEDLADIEPMNHREFPFSERQEYAKFSVDDALATSKNQSQARVTKDHHLVNRLSIYVHQDMMPREIETQQSSGDDDDSSDISDHAEQDEETVMSEVATGDLVYDDSDMEEDEMAPPPVSLPTELASAHHGKCRQIRVGPPQDNDVMPLKRIPPQVHLARIEGMLHKLSLDLANDMVQAPVKQCFDESTANGFESNPHHDNDHCHDLANCNCGSNKKKKKKLQWDDFDRLLGWRDRNPNPVFRITSSFLGPLMRMLRIFLHAVRVSFNVTTWRDPFLSFWVLFTLVLMFLILLVFPYRLFFFVMGWVCLGPQNVFVRKYLEKEASKSPEKEKEPEKEPSVSMNNNNPSESSPSDDAAANDRQEPKAGPRKRIQNRLAQYIEKRDEKRRLRRGESSSVDTETASHVSVETATGNGIGVTPSSSVTQRQAFATPVSNGKATTTRKAMQPREIVVPYGRLRKERFYDWPPDPTVSRATPMLLTFSTGIISCGDTGTDALVQKQQQQQVLQRDRLVGMRRNASENNAQFRKVLTTTTSAEANGSSSSSHHRRAAQLFTDTGSNNNTSPSQRCSSDGSGSGGMFHARPPALETRHQSLD